MGIELPWGRRFFSRNARWPPSFLRYGLSSGRVIHASEGPTGASEVRDR